jgi:hypothetical protein
MNGALFCDSNELNYLPVFKNIDSSFCILKAVTFCVVFTAIDRRRRRASITVSTDEPFAVDVQNHFSYIHLVPAPPSLMLMTVDIVIVVSALICLVSLL